MGAQVLENLAHPTCAPPRLSRCDQAKLRWQTKTLRSLSTTRTGSACFRRISTSRQRTWMQNVNVEITFDDENRIRVLQKDKYKQTENLDAECQGFSEKIETFGGTVNTLVEILDGQAQKIE